MLSEVPWGIQKQQLEDCVMAEQWRSWGTFCLEVGDVSAFLVWGGKK